MNKSSPCAQITTLFAPRAEQRGTVSATLMAHMVVSAVVQQSVSKVNSYLFGKHDDNDKTTSREHNIERLEVAHTELELALERSARMPITDVSLLRRRKL